MTLVIDASVAVKWYMAEDRSDAATLLLQSNELFVAPDLIVVEVANVLWRRHRVGDITLDHVRRALADLPGQFLPLTAAEMHAARAMEIAVTIDHPIYDCFYLAVAESWSTSLVTADSKLLLRVQSTPWQASVREL